MSLLAALSRAKGGGAGARQSKVVELPAPILGWNVRDGWAGMDPKYAVRLDNLFPEAAYIRLREGYEEHCEISAIAKTIFCYAYEGVSKLLAFTDSKIIDVSTSTPSDLDTGLTNGFWSTVTHGGHGIFVNGADTPRKFDGSAISTTTFTGSGLTATDLYGVISHKHRLYFWTENSTTFWYTDGVDAIAGTLVAFDLKYVHNTRGRIVGMGTWTFDGGAGVDDVLAIFMADGQVYAYSGSDPGDATDWALIGVFDIGGHPMGRRNIAQYGGDLIVLTENGYFPLSKALTLGSVSNAVTVSDVINGEVVNLSRLFASNDYWQVILRGNESQLLVNVPSSDFPGTYDQHVMNTRTGAWCRYRGWNASCFFEHTGNLYWSSLSEPKIFKVDSSLSADDGANIEGYGLQAYWNAGYQGLKRFTMARPLVQSDSAAGLALGFGIDYEEPPGFSALSSVSTVGTEWDTGEWDTFEWGAENPVQRSWQSVYGIGYTAAIGLKVNVRNTTIQWFGTGVMYEPGGQI